MNKNNKKEKLGFKSKNIFYKKKMLEKKVMQTKMANNIHYNK